jgi:hypothetical protein
VIILENVLITKDRMCMANSLNGGCRSCLLYAGDSHSCSERIFNNPDETIALITKWGEEHPLPKVKTILDDFKEKYPNARLEDNGIPTSCAYNLGYIPFCVSCCQECWSRPLSEVQNDKP